MTGPKKWQLEDLLARPEVQKATSNINPELMERRLYKPPICEVFSKPFSRLETADGYRFEIDREAQQKLPKIINADVLKIEGVDSLNDVDKNAWEKPRKIGIVFSGGPAPGGHNVIAGLYDAAKKANASNQIFGFLVGPDGIIEGESIALTDQLVNDFRNLGGFTMIKTGRTKIDTPQKMGLSRQTILDMGLDALVVVGGDDSNTNAAFFGRGPV
jgi:pyrophosphate--fructose-6-phosphate 1-phosphotransferase